MTVARHIHQVSCSSVLESFLIEVHGSISNLTRKTFLYVRIDRRRKLPATVLLRALGYSTDELLAEFYQREIIHLSESVELFYREPADLKMSLGQKATIEVVDSNGEAVVRKNRKFTQSALKKMRAAEVTRIPAMLEEIVDKVLAEDIVDYSTGEVIAECNTALTEAMIEDLRGRGITEIPTLYIDDLTVGLVSEKHLVADKLDTPEEAILEIYKRLRPGDPPTLETAYNLFNNLFFNPERYD